MHVGAQKRIIRSTLLKILDFNRNSSNDGVRLIARSYKEALTAYSIDGRII